MRFRGGKCFFPLVLVAVAILAGQTAQAPQEVRVSTRPWTPPASSSYTFRAQANLVEVGVVVRDRDGHAVAGLGRENFKIYDEGKERPITAFAADADSPEPAVAQKTTPGTAAAENPVVAPTQPTPRYIALLFDDVNIKPNDLNQTRLAAMQFLNGGMRSGDHVGVLTTSGAVNTAFTADRDAVIAGLAKLQSHQRVPEDGIVPCPRITPYQAYLIVSLDQLALQAAADEASQCLGGLNEGVANVITTAGASSQVINAVRVQAEETWEQVRVSSQVGLDMIERVIEGMAKAPGTRVVLLASPGFLAGTLEEQQNRIVNKALAAGVVINSLDTKGLWAGTPARTTEEMNRLVRMPQSTRLFDTTAFQAQGQWMAAPLATFSEGTGGAFFQNSNDLAGGIRQLAGAPHASYRLGFLGDEENKPKFHKLKVTLVSPHLYSVQARAGYFASGASAPAAEPKPARTARERLEDEVMASDSPADFPATVTAAEGKGDDGAPVVWAAVHVDLKQIRFTTENEHELQTLTLITVLLDGSGKVMAAKESRMDFSLSEATFLKLIETGLNAKVFLKAAPGSYHLREVVQEGLEGRMAASTQPVEVHSPAIAR
jgi:VWFA-related protein